MKPCLLPVLLNDQILQMWKYLSVFLQLLLYLLFSFDDLISFDFYYYCIFENKDSSLNAQKYGAKRCSDIIKEENQHFIIKYINKGNVLETIYLCY